MRPAAADANRDPDRNPGATDADSNTYAATAYPNADTYSGATNANADRYANANADRYANANADCYANANADRYANANADRYANTYANTGCSLDCLRYISRIEYRRDSDRRRWRRAYRIYNRMGDAGRLQYIRVEPGLPKFLLG
jgi:hypothetical protein